MAWNNEFNGGSPFCKLVQNEFERYYTNGSFSQRRLIDFDQRFPNYHRLERFDQNYPFEASEESGGGHDRVGSQFGFPQPNARDHEIATIRPHNNAGFLSSSPAIPQSFDQQSYGVQTWDSHNVSSSIDVGNKKNNTPHRATDLFIAVSLCAEENKRKIIDLASKAMDELKKVAMEGPPLWSIDLDKDIEMLNNIEYMKEIANAKTAIAEILRLIKVKDYTPLPSSPRSNKASYDVLSEAPSQDDDLLHTEGTRETGHVGVKPTKLVELLMDSKQWSQVFSKIVSRAKVLRVLASTGIPQQNYEGTVQVMGAEFYGPTPQIPTREIYFARYCKRFCQRMWGVVDVSLETLFQFPSAKRIEKRPSGCLITEMPDGSSKVIWVEHVQVDDGFVHEIFEPIVDSGFAFSAKRWFSILAQHCALMAPCTPIVDGVLIIPEPGIRSILNLSERMMGSFVSETNAYATNEWKELPVPEANGDSTLMMTKTNKDDPGMPTATTVVFASSALLPATPKQVFDFLSSENSRSEWDILSQGHYHQEIARITTSQYPGNHLSIFQVNSTPDNIEAMYLQRCYTDSAASYVVFAPLDITTVSSILSGENSDFVRILPCGFVILPDVSKMRGGIASGSLLTLALHIVDDVTAAGQRITPDSIDLMYQIITDAVSKIKDAMA